MGMEGLASGLRRTHNAHVVTKTLASPITVHCHKKPEVHALGFLHSRIHGTTPTTLSNVVEQMRDLLANGRIQIDSHLETLGRVVMSVEAQDSLRNIRTSQHRITPCYNVTVVWVTEALR